MSRGQSAFDFVGSAAGLRGAFQLREVDADRGKLLRCTEAVQRLCRFDSSPRAGVSRSPEAAIGSFGDYQYNFQRQTEQYSGIDQGRGISNQTIQCYFCTDWTAFQLCDGGCRPDKCCSWRLCTGKKYTFATDRKGPSDDLMMGLERATGTRQTTDWDGDGVEISQQYLNPPVDLIPSHVRGSTPDSVASSGNIRLNNVRGEHTDLSTRHLQDNVEHRTNNTVMNMAKSTRAFVQQFSSENNQPSTSAEDVEFEMRPRPDETDGPIPDKTEEFQEKNRLFLPKCILLVVIVMIALAGIVALIVVVDKDAPKERGQILPDPITEVECPSRSFSLGDELNFTCTFNVQHEYRKVLLDDVEAYVIPKNRVVKGSSLAFDVESAQNSSHRTFTFIGNDLTAKCSSEGSYDVIFRNQNGKYIHNATVTFSVKGSSLTTTFKQRQLKGTNCLKSEFDATCVLHNDCNKYHTKMFTVENGVEKSLNNNVTCESNYTDADGYMVNCSATIPESLVEDFVGLGCRMETTRRDNRRFKLEKMFRLPECGVESSCHTYIPSNPRPFNCSEKGTDVQRLFNATCDFTVLTSCFKPGRQIFTGIYKDYTNKLTCSEDDTVPVCRLSWCRDYRYIVKNEIPGVAICPQTFEERYVTPPTEAPSTAGPK